MMTTTIDNKPTHHADFLYRVAEHLYMTCGGDMSRMVVVFPNKRAALFFKIYLAEVAGGPVWLPECIAMNELPLRFTKLRQVDKVKAVCLLYRVYAACLTADGCSLDASDSFDRFYGWGERMLADFNEIDRQLPPAVAAKVFENVGDYESLNDSPIADNTEAFHAITQLIRHWRYDASQQERERFMKLWQHLPQIHREFVALLREQPHGPEGYEALLWRDALTHADALLEADEHSFAFVGHNALSQVEQELLLKIKDHKKEQCLFYWDYDARYTADTTREAGLYMRKNLAKSGFSNALGKPTEQPLPTINYISASTNSAQVRYATTWLRELKSKHPDIDERRVAIVLCDEGLLQPLLHVIPEEVNAVNITKGFPLKQTIAYRDLMAAIKKQTAATHSDVAAFIRAISTTLREQMQLSQVAKPLYATSTNVADVLRALNTEAYFKVSMQLNQFESLAKEGVFATVDGVAPLSDDVLFPMIGRLITQAVGMMSVPFHGEPVCGVQIMGLLETRTLDFDHLLFIGANDGKLPLIATNNSFIPYPIRRFYGLPTAEDRIAVSAYYFNRLLHRAQHLTLLYNNSTFGNSKGEMSRFMWELLVDYDDKQLPVAYYAIDDRPRTHGTPLLAISKTADMMRGLVAPKQADDGSIKEHSFSPSSLATYRNCSLAFYYKYIAKLRKPQDKQALLPANVMGTIFHNVCERIYTPLKGQAPIDIGVLESYVANRDNRLECLIAEVLASEAIKKEAPDADKDKIACAAILQWVQQLLRHDIALVKDGLVVHQLEEEVQTTIHTRLDGESLACRIKGVVDRIDEVDVDGTRVLRILDYKTGGSPKKFSTIEQLFKSTDKAHRYILQTLIYAYVLQREGLNKALPIAPALYYIKSAQKPDFQPYISMGDKKGSKQILNFDNYADEVGLELQGLMDQLFDLSLPFEATENSDTCMYCDFKTLCKR